MVRTKTSGGAPLIVAWTLSLLACGGTSSETPWPVEPDETPLGPAAETSRPGVVDQVEVPEEAPDAGAKKKRAGEGAEPAVPRNEPEEP